MKTYEDPSIAKDARIASLKYDYDAQPKEDVVSCNLCGADEWRVITERDRYGFNATTTACLDCGLTVLNPRMTASGYAHFYQGVYRPLVSAFYGRRIDPQSIQDEQRAYSEEIERFLKPHAIGWKGKTFLDVGGSTGVVSVHFAEQFGLVPTVLDPAPDEIAEADKYGIETITALVEDWDSAGKKYDVVGMFQTIDHLLDVMGTFQKLRSVIAEDGVFIVDIVDFRYMYRKKQSVSDATKIDHPYSITEMTAEVYLASTGFDPIAKQRSEDGHLVAYLCKPCEPDYSAMPPIKEVDAYFSEIEALTVQETSS